MKDFFDPTVVQNTEQRMLQLGPESRRQWGTMEIAPTLAHCTSGFQMAMGVLQAKRAPFPASLVGLVIKPLMLRDDKPMRRNSPTAPELLVMDPASCSFESERSRLIAAMRQFAAGGPAGCSRYPHPFFGPLKPQEWALLMFKHVDHHLRQFGV